MTVIRHHYSLRDSVTPRVAAASYVRSNVRTCRDLCARKRMREGEAERRRCSSKVNIKALSQQECITASNFIKETFWELTQSATTSISLQIILRFVSLLYSCTTNKSPGSVYHGITPTRCLTMAAY